MPSTNIITPHSLLEFEGTVCRADLFWTRLDDLV